MRTPIAYCILLLGPLASCGLLPDSRGEFTGTPYISRTVNVGVAGAGEIEYEGLLEVAPGERVRSVLKVIAGLGPGFELFAGWSPYHSSGGGADSRGGGDVSVGTKYQVADGSGGRPRAIVEVASRLPTSNAGPAGRNGEADFFVASSVGQAFGEVSLIGTYELGLLGEANNDSVVLEHNAILAAAYQVQPGLRTFTELSLVYLPKDAEIAWFGGTGAGLKLNSALEFQGAVQIGLNDDADDYLLVFGFNYGAGQLLPVLRQ